MWIDDMVGSILETDRLSSVEKKRFFQILSENTIYDGIKKIYMDALQSITDELDG